MRRKSLLVIMLLTLVVLLGACESPNPQLPALTPIPPLTLDQTPTLNPILAPPVIPGTAITATPTITVTPTLQPSVTPGPGGPS